MMRCVAVGGECEEEKMDKFLNSFRLRWHRHFSFFIAVSLFLYDGTQSGEKISIKKSSVEVRWHLVFGSTCSPVDDGGGELKDFSVFLPIIREGFLLEQGLPVKC